MNNTVTVAVLLKPATASPGDRIPNIIKAHMIRRATTSTRIHSDINNTRAPANINASIIASIEIISAGKNL